MIISFQPDAAKMFREHENIREELMSAARNICRKQKVTSLTEATVTTDIRRGAWGPAENID